MRVPYPFTLECGVYKTSYRQDLALHHTRLAQLRLWVLIGLLFVFPLLVSPYWIRVTNLVGIFIIGAIGLNILTGYTGQISIGHAAFMGVGAYTSGFVTTKLGLPFEVGLVSAGIVAALVGSVFGLPSLRLKGLYLAMATLAAQVILEWIFAHWDPVTGGTHGMNLPHASILGFRLNTPLRFYYLVLVLCLAGAVFAQNLFRSRVGRAFMAVRDRDIAAEIIGVDLFRYKIMAFAVSSFYAGISGSLWGHYTRVISPEHFHITLSIEFLAMIIIGGLGSIMGAVYGAAFMTLMPIVLRNVTKFLSEWWPILDDKFIGVKAVVFGAVIIAFLVFEPEGLAKLWRNVKDYFKLWPFSY